jgi:antitoxin component YwqK of YwqJK toxin-antitoxin module
MRVYILISCLFLALSSSAQLPNDVAPASVLDGVYIKQVDSSLIVSKTKHGTWYGPYLEYYDSLHTKIQYEGNYELKYRKKDSLWYSQKTGIWNHYNTLGQIFHKRFYNEKGEEYKTCDLFYYPNGQLRKEEIFGSPHDNTADDTLVFRDTLNDLLYSQVDIYFRVKIGLHKVYYPNGQLKSIGKYYPIYFDHDQDLTPPKHGPYGVLDGVYVREGPPTPKPIVDRYAKDSIWTEYDSLGNKIGETRWDKGQFISGTWIQYYDNDQIYHIGELVNWKKEGEWKYYFHNGILNSKTTYKDGAVAGNSSSNYFSGKPNSKAVKKGETTTQRYWYESGQLKEIGNYTKKGRQGKRSYYYENGKLEQERNYKNGLQNGEEKKYNKNGQLAEQHHYRIIEPTTADRKLKFKSENLGTSSATPRNDSLHSIRTGTSTFYHPNGKIHQKGSYYPLKFNFKTEYLKEGVWEEYDSTGKRMPKTEYRNGAVYNGWYYDLYRYGNVTTVKYQVKVVNGKREGLWKRFSHRQDKLGDGKGEQKLLGKGAYKKGKEHGKWEWFSEVGGYTRKVEHWKNGMKEGLFAEFNSKGRQVKGGLYKNDKQEGLWNEVMHIYYRGIRTKRPEDAKEIMLGGLYVDGKKEGKWVERKWSTNIKITNYKSGQLHGVYEVYVLKKDGKSWPEDFQLQQRSNYENGLRAGEIIHYHKDGSIAKKGTYRLPTPKDIRQESQKTGDWYEYDKTGKIITEEHYSDSITDTLPSYFNLPYMSRDMYRSVLLPNLNKRGAWLNNNIRDHYWHKRNYQIGFYKEGIGLIYDNWNIRANKFYPTKRGYCEIDSNLQYMNRYPNGQLKTVGNYLPGLIPEGKTYQAWYANGQKKEDVVSIKFGYDRYVRNYITQWHANGQIKMKGQIIGSYPKQQRKDSLWSYWYDNGQLAKQINYFAQPDSALPYTTWYKSGQKKSIGPMSYYHSSGYMGNYSYNDGEHDIDYILNGLVKQGYWTTWYKSGITASKGEYLNDRKTGLWTHYFDTGKGNGEIPMSMGKMKDDRKVGVWTYFNQSTGMSLATIDYGNGMPNGELPSEDSNWKNTNGPEGCDPTSFYLDKNGKWWLGTGSSGGVYTSTNKGKTWTAFNKGIGPVHVRYMGKLGDKMYIETGIGDSWKREGIFELNDDFWQPITEEKAADSIHNLLKADAAKRHIDLPFPVMYASTMYFPYINKAVRNFRYSRSIVIKYDSSNVVSPQLKKSFPNDVHTLPGSYHFKTGSKSSVLLAKSGVYKFDQKTFQPAGISGLVASDIKYMLAATDTSFWVLEGYKNIWRYKNNTWKQYFNGYKNHSIDPHKDYSTHAPTLHPNGTLLFGAGGDIRKITADGQSSILLRGSFFAEDSARFHQSAAIDKDGSIWTVTKFNGYHKLIHYGENGNLLEVTSTIPEHEYLGMYAYLTCDKAGKIWLVQYDGIQQLGSNSNPNAKYNDDDFKHHSPASIAIGNNGKIAYYLNESTIIIWNGAEWERKETEQLKGMLSLGFDSNDDLYAGTGFIDVHACGILTYGRAHGLFKLNGTDWEQIENKVNPWILSLATHPVLGIAVGTSGSGLWILKTED